MASEADRPPARLIPDPDDEPTRRERAAAILEQRLDAPMAVLAVLWTALVAYELIAPTRHRDELAIVGNIIWAIFVVELVAKLWVSGHPLRFLRRRWPSVLFLLLPMLRILRLLRAVRALRALPLVRVVGSGYRAVGSARRLLGGRLTYLGAVTATVIFAGGQMLYLVEGGPEGDRVSLGDALWWSANLAVSGSTVFAPETALGRLISIGLSVFAIVVFASVAAAFGAFFVEARAEREEEGAA